jgi:hypothetical protein
MWKRQSRLFQRLAIGALALMLGACGISQPQNVPGLRAVVGSSLPGAQGATVSDQDRIDEHMARACPVGLYTGLECDRHTVASSGRREALAAR